MHFFFTRDPETRAGLPVQGAAHANLKGDLGFHRASCRPVHVKRVVGSSLTQSEMTASVQENKPKHRTLFNIY